MFTQRLLTLLSGCLIAAFTVSAIAGTNIDVNVGIVTPPPPPVIVAAPPMGYSTCYRVPGTWARNIWIPSHRECAYPGGPSGSPVWISGYWGCDVIGPYGRCGHWRWYVPRWRGHPYYRHGGYAYYDNHYDREYRHRW